MDWRAWQTVRKGELTSSGETKTRPLARRKIQVAFGTAILALFVMGVVSYQARVLSNESERWVEHTHEVLENLQDLELDLETVKSSYREFALTGDESSLVPFRGSELSAMQHIGTLRTLTIDNASQQRRMGEIEQSTAKRFQFAETLVEMRRTKGPDAAADAVRIKHNQQFIHDVGTAVIHQAQAEELRLLVIREADAAKRLRQTKASLVALTAFALLIVLVAGTNLQRESLRRVLTEGLLGNQEATAELLDLTSDAILVRNLRNEIIFWNKSAESLYGWSKTEVLGRTTHDLLQTVFPAALEGIEAEVLRKGNWEGELIHQRRNGRLLTVSSRWAVQKNSNGRPIAILESNRDVSQRRLEDSQFRGLMEAAPDAMVVVNQSGEIVLLNLQAERKFGYSRDELLGQKVKSIIPEGFAERLIADGTRTATEALLQQMGMGIELSGRRKDGGRFPIEIMLSPLTSAEGILVTAAIRDISVRKSEEESLRQSEERMSLVVRNARDYAILMLDLDGRVVSWNDGAERMKGYRAEEILGSHFSIFYTTEDRANGVPERELDEARRNGRVEGEGWRVRKDGSQFYSNVVITALRDKTGRLRGFGKIARDITERVRAEEDHAKAAAELNRSNNQLGQFAYVASHDLQEPLRMVASYTQLLAKRYKGRLDADADEFIGFAVDGCNRMQGLIRDLLAYSRSGGDKKATQAISVDSALNEALVSLHISIEDSGAIVTHDPLPDLTSDKTQLVQIFQNLVGNAIKYHGAAAPLVHISAAMTKGGKGWTFSVRDNGLGIAPEYFERIFVIFQRLHGKGEFEGTGIGLAICKKNVEQLGGRIWVESEPEKGSTFYFALPGGEEV